MGRGGRMRRGILAAMSFNDDRNGDGENSVGSDLRPSTHCLHAQTLTRLKFLDRQDRSTKRHRMKSLQLQEAKQQFSAVAEKAAGGQPQIVTKHGKPFVVILSVADWKKSRVPRRTLLEMLRSCPVDLTELDITRSRELPRDLGL